MALGMSAGTLPPCTVTRGGRVSLTPNQWLTWHPAPQLGPLNLPAEWVLRQLQTVDLDDPLWLMTILDMRGMCWSTVERLRNPAVTPEELGPAPRPARDDLHARVHLSDVQALLAALRRAGGQWLDYVDTGRPLPDSFWWLLHAGCRQFSLIVVDRADQLEGDLFEAACWQLYGIVRAEPPVKRCVNERCGRLFYRQTPEQHLDGRVKYCSAQCREAQKKRVQRRRSRESERLVTPLAP